MAHSERLNFATLNVRGLRSSQKQAQLRRLIARKRLDFVAIQETKIESDEETERALRPFLCDYNVCVSHANGLSAGCWLFLRKSLPRSAITTSVDNEGRYICCDIVLQGVPWRIISLYAFNEVSQRLDFFNNLSGLIASDRCTVLMGDFNCVCDPNDRRNRDSRRDKSGELLSDIVANAGLIDIDTSGHVTAYTRLQGCSCARLDRIYVSSSLISREWSCNTEPVSFSDHCIVIGQMGANRRNQFRPQWALWKINSELLRDQEFIYRVRAAKMKSFSMGLHIFAAWELFKQEVRSIAIEIGSVKSYYRKNEEKTLLKSLCNLYEMECEGPG